MHKPPFVDGKENALRLPFYHTRSSSVIWHIVSFRTKNTAKHRAAPLHPPANLSYVIFVNFDTRRYISGKGCINGTNGPKLYESLSYPFCNSHQRIERIQLARSVKFTLNSSRSAIAVFSGLVRIAN